MNRSLGSSEDRLVATAEVPTSAVIFGLPNQTASSLKYKKPLYQAIKRSLDVGVSALILLLLLPAFALIAILISLSDGFPVMIRHRRVGQNGKEMHILKFRTMVRNAESVLQSHPELLAKFEKNFKLDADPRVTKMGCWLRQTSIDEFPQLINVICGDMSLVGPRPIVEAELEKYGEDCEAYLAMKPGCAGLWQCSGRSRTTYEERVALDALYFETASTSLDIQIILRTFVSMLKRDGAC